MAKPKKKKKMEEKMEKNKKDRKMTSFNQSLKVVSLKMEKNVKIPQKKTWRKKTWNFLICFFHLSFVNLL